MENKVFFLFSQGRNISEVSASDMGKRELFFKPIFFLSLMLSGAAATGILLRTLRERERKRLQIRKEEEKVSFSWEKKHSTVELRFALE